MSYWDKELLMAGLAPDTLTEDQKDAILTPLEAPENYYHDGEIDENEAHEIWCEQMRETGLTRIQIPFLATHLLSRRNRSPPGCIAQLVARHALL